MDGSSTHEDLDRSSKRKKKHYEKRKEKRRLQRAYNEQPVTSNPGDPTRPSGQPSNHLHEIGIARGKGIGLFARQKIPRGTCILSENPLLIAPADVQPQVVLEKIKNLPEDKLAQFTDLCSDTINKAKCVTQLTDYDNFLFSIWRINTFGCPLGGIAVYATASRVNHSCTPNMMFSHMQDNATMEAHTTRDIAEGEELTWAYVDVCQTYDGRMTHLKAACPDLGLCRCDTCNGLGYSNALPMVTSEKKRARMADLRSFLAGYQSEERLRQREYEVSVAALALEKLLIEEKLEGLELAKVYNILSRLMTRHGVENAVIWKRKEADIMRCIFGARSPKAKGCDMELDQLEEAVRLRASDGVVMLE